MVRNRRFIHVKPVFAVEIQLRPRSECPSDAGVDEQGGRQIPAPLRMAGRYPDRRNPYAMKLAERLERNAGQWQAFCNTLYSHYNRAGSWSDDWKDVYYADLWLKEEADYNASY